MPEENSGLYKFSQELIALLDKLNKEHATLKAAWFALNEFYLAFAGRCKDAALRAEAFKLIKELSSNIPLQGEVEGNDLEEPMNKELNVDELIDKVRIGRILKPSEIK